MAPSIPQSECSKITNSSCKASYDLALEIPERRFLPLAVGQPRLEGQPDLEGEDSPSTYQCEGSPKCRLILNLPQRESDTKEAITYMTTATKKKHRLHYSSRDFLMANDRNPTPTGHQREVTEPLTEIPAHEPRCCDDVDERLLPMVKSKAPLRPSAVILK